MPAVTRGETLTPAGTGAAGQQQGQPEYRETPSVYKGPIPSYVEKVRPLALLCYLQFVYYHQYYHKSAFTHLKALSRCTMQFQVLSYLRSPICDFELFILVNEIVTFYLPVTRRPL